MLDFIKRVGAVTLVTIIIVLLFFFMVFMACMGFGFIGSGHYILGIVLFVLDALCFGIAFNIAKYFA